MLQKVCVVAGLQSPAHTSYQLKLTWSCGRGKLHSHSGSSSLITNDQVAQTPPTLEQKPVTALWQAPLAASGALVSGWVMLVFGPDRSQRNLYYVAFGARSSKATASQAAIQKCSM